MLLLNNWEDIMKDLVKAMDKLPKLVKVLLALPVLDIVWAIYRLCRSGAKKNVVGVVLAVIMIIVCASLFWLVDIITIILANKVLWID